MIEQRFDAGVAGATKSLAARPVDGEAVLVLHNLSARSGERGGHRGQAVALLHAQLLQPSGAGGARCERGGDEQHRELVDHRGRNRRIDIDAGEGRVAHAQIGHGLAADLAGVHLLDIRAHLAQHFDEAGAGRVEADIHDRQVAARHQRGGDHEEGGRGGIAGDGYVAGLQFRLAVDGDDGLAVLHAHFEASAEAGQHPLGMVAGRDRLDHAGDAGGVEARQQHRAFHLRACDR